VNGFDSGRILARLPRFRRYLSDVRLHEELEAHPPALVVVAGDWRIIPCPSEQRETLNEFLRRKGYLAVRVGTIWFAVRPDRCERARRDGFL